MTTLSEFIKNPFFYHFTKDCDVTDNKPSQAADHPVKDSQMTHPTDATSPHNTTATAPAEGLNHEEVRRITFANWPLTFINSNVLAMTGFYFVGPADTVRCHFCRVEIGRWEPEDNEVTEHQRWSQNCPLLRRRQTNNVPIDADLLDRTLPPVTYDVCGLNGGLDIRQHTISEGSFQPMVATTASTMYGPRDSYAVQQSPMQPQAVSSSMKPPEHPEYAIEAVRLRSYEDWPKMMKQNPQQLTDAGFFYTSKGDRVKCFSCGVGLRDWDENDEPWEQHALWHSTCEYLKLVKGPAFIASVLEAAKKRKQEASEAKAVASEGSAVEKKTSVETAPEPPKREHEGGSDKKCDLLCKICYSNEYDTAFLPCGHVTACTKCAYTVTKCPMCREPFERVVRVYLS